MCVCVCIVMCLCMHVCMCAPMSAVPLSARRGHWIPQTGINKWL